MKQKRGSVLGLWIVCIISILALPSPSSLSAQTSHIKYFGYLGSNFIGENAVQTPAESYDHTNIVWICAGIDCSLTWKDQVTQATALGQKILLYVVPTFFNQQELVANYQARWQNLLSQLTPELMSNVAAFYIIDEPPTDVNSITATWSNRTSPNYYDSIAMYNSDVGANNSQYLNRLYVNSASCTKTNNGVNGICSFTAPKEGHYEFRMFGSDNISDKIATSNSFTVSETTYTPQIFWSNTSGVTQGTNSLVKTGGVNGAWDAGAISSQSITSGDGYIQFSTNENATNKMAGLGTGDSSQHFGDIEFAIYFAGGRILIYEKGSMVENLGSPSGLPYNIDDTFTIAVISGQVKYYKNGSLLYTSTQSPTYPLVFDTSFNETGATISNASIIQGTYSASNQVMLSASPTSVILVGPKVQALRNVTALIKTSFPQIPIAVVFGQGSEPRPEQISSGFDWVGWDCYGEFTADNYGCDIPARTTKLESMINNNQKIILIPEGNSFTVSPNGVSSNGLVEQDAQNRLINRINLFYQLAVSDSHVIGIFPITWSSYNEGSVRVLGTRDMPQVKARYIQIGQAITGGTEKVLLSVSPTSITPGKNILATWSGHTNSKTLDWIGLYPTGSTGINNSFPIGRLYVSSASCGSLSAGVTSGSCTFQAPTVLGAYELRFFSNDTLTKLATSNTFTVTASSGTSIPPVNPPAPQNSGGGGGGGGTTNTIQPPQNSGGGSSSSQIITPTSTQPKAVMSPLPITPTTSVITVNLSRTIYVGMKGSDIVALQNILINLGYLANGNNTGYFGVLTRSAVQKYQCAKGIVCGGDEESTGYGLVGKKTRATLAK
jgi:hypothetical protein